MIFGSLARLNRTDLSELQISLNGTRIEPVTSAKVLGFYLDSTLSFKLHVEKLCSKLNTGLHFMRVAASL